MRALHLAGALTCGLGLAFALRRPARVSYAAPVSHRTAHPRTATVEFADDKPIGECYPQRLFGLDNPYLADRTSALVADALANRVASPAAVAPAAAAAVDSGDAADGGDDDCGDDRVDLVTEYTADDRRRRRRVRRSGADRGDADAASPEVPAGADLTWRVDDASLA
jgi:hypothetical protein